MDVPAPAHPAIDGSRSDAGLELVRRAQQDFVQAFALLRPAPLRFRAHFRHLHPHALGELLHRLDELQPAILHQEPDRSAVGTAAEAVVPPAIGVHGKARRPLLVEGAPADEARALLSDRSVIVADNVMPEFNMLDIEPARAAIRQIFIDRIVHVP